MASDEEVDESFAGEDEVEETGNQVSSAGQPIEGSSEAEESQRLEDDDYEPEERKKKKGKKRKARSEDKKGKKKKKKKKSDSGDESDFGGGDNADVAGEDSDYASNRKSRKSSSRKSSSHAASATATPTPVTQGQQEPATGMPTIEEVCSTFALTDVAIEYSDADFQNLTTYKLFQQHVRPLLAKENPKVPMSKLMMLVAAKWRDFSEMNPHTQPEVEVSSQSVDEESRSVRANRSAVVQDDDEEDDDEDSDRKKKSRSSRAKKGKKASKVPTLKIKLGKRKRGSSDEEVEGSGDRKSVV